MSCEVLSWRAPISTSRPQRAPQLVLNPTGVGGNAGRPHASAGWRVCDRLIEWLNCQTSVNDRFSRCSIECIAHGHINRTAAEDRSGTSSVTIQAKQRRQANSKRTCSQRDLRTSFCLDANAQLDVRIRSDGGIRSREPRPASCFQDRAQVRPCSCCDDRHPWRIDAPENNFRREAFIPRSVHGFKPMMLRSG